MKLSTLALIILWPTAVFFTLYAIATAFAAWHYSKDRGAQALNKLQGQLTGKQSYYPWKERSVYACVSLLLLAYLQGWLILA